MQAVMAVVMLVYLLGVGTGVLSFISAQSSGTAQNLFTWAPKGGYQSAESALATALLQGFFSYPFHDPVCAPTAGSPPEIIPRSPRDRPEIAYDPSFGPPEITRDHTRSHEITRDHLFLAGAHRPYLPFQAEGDAPLILRGRHRVGTLAATRTAAPCARDGAIVDPAPKTAPWLSCSELSSVALSSLRSVPRHTHRACSSFSSPPLASWATFWPPHLTASSTKATRPASHENCVASLSD